MKALIGSRGSKERRNSGLFVAEGMQSLREALASQHGPLIETLYLSPAGRERASDLDLSEVNTVDVTDAVMQEMTSTVTPQGVLMVCSIPSHELSQLELRDGSFIIYLDRIQDPGNAGTIVRSADAFGAHAVITSPGSVDMYSPKVVRSTAGSLWHIPVIESQELSHILNVLHNPECLLLSSHATESIVDFHSSGPCIAIFGNEGAGTSSDQLAIKARTVTIPMSGKAESLNLSAAASIVMFTLSRPSRG
ncbi:MAG: TrmH family RNA methyltransferase [Candidatus Planktophila sp.]